MACFYNVWEEREGREAFKTRGNSPDKRFLAYSLCARIEVSGIFPSDLNLPPMPPVPPMFYNNIFSIKILYIMYNEDIIPYNNIKDITTILKHYINTQRHLFNHGSFMGAILF